MGLDMYLVGYIHLWEHNTGELPIVIRVNNKDITLDVDDTIKKQLAYWRKANAIHNWFVENCGDGIDECQEMFVSKDKLKELLDICEEVMYNKNRAEELLPTRGGCFFGSLEYDDNYFYDVEHTIKTLKDIINNPTFDYVYYQASW